MCRIILLLLFCIFSNAAFAASPANTLINPANGNVLLTETDYTGYGAAPLEIRRYYNSITAKAGRFGLNWSDTFARVLTVQSVENFFTAKITRPDGKTFTFQRVGSAPWYAAPDNGALLRDTAQGGWQLFTPEETETYNQNGRLTSLRNSEGHSYQFSYDASGRLSGVVNSFGRGIAYTYDANNRVQTVTDPASGVYQYAYNAQGMLSTVTFPGGTTRQYLYGEAGQASGAKA
ncbi:MAG: RHS repeat protein, partial [Sulfuricella sp.]|nr:RHS repeat protein [Sulfuricella sp.]